MPNVSMFSRKILSNVANTLTLLRLLCLQDIPNRLLALFKSNHTETAKGLQGTNLGARIMLYVLRQFAASAVYRFNRSPFTD